MLIIGAGDIGSRTGAVLRALGADVVLVARTPRAGVHGIAALPELLADAAVVVLAVPSTPETLRLVDAPFLAALPDGAVVVNVARGVVVDTEALTREVASGRLRAALDVVDPEPLPATHPLWGLPGVLITPHVGGGAGGWLDRAGGVILAQAECLSLGAPLRNEVIGGY